MRLANGDATPSELRLLKNECLFPRVAKAQPWAGIRERFQRYSSPSSFTRTTALGSVPTFCAKLRRIPLLSANFHKLFAQTLLNPIEK